MSDAGAARGSFVRGVSLFGAIALVAGNMLGTSLYTLPASLATAVGPLGLLSWVITAAGFLLLALLYASLGTRFPRTGGPNEPSAKAESKSGGEIAVQKDKPGRGTPAPALGKGKARV